MNKPVFSKRNVHKVGPFAFALGSAGWQFTIFGPKIIIKERSWWFFGEQVLLWMGSIEKPSQSMRMYLSLNRYY